MIERAPLFNAKIIRMWWWENQEKFKWKNSYTPQTIVSLINSNGRLQLWISLLHNETKAITKTQQISCDVCQKFWSIGSRWNRARLCTRKYSKIDFLWATSATLLCQVFRVIKRFAELLVLVHHLLWACPLLIYEISLVYLLT